jgi:glutaredoxin
MSNTTVTFYTRGGCHLCEDAKKDLLELKKSWNFILEEVDIDQSDELTERYGLMIPVVLIDGEEAGFGRIDPFEISNRLQKKVETF